MSEATEMPAFAFADGALRIHTPRAEMRIQWRPKPLAEELIPGAGRWNTFWPEFRLVRPIMPPKSSSVFALDVDVDNQTGSLAEKKDSAFTAFRREVPAEMVAVVEPFCSHQWAMLLLLNEQPRSLDLALSNPVLAYCLANNKEFRGTGIGVASVQAVWYSHRKQRAILEWLGFPGTEAMAKVMRKIPPEHANPSILRRLRNVGKTDTRAFDMLAHLPVINAAALELVTAPQLIDLITPKLLSEAAGKETEPDTLSPGDMLIGALGILHTIAPRRTIQSFMTIEQVRRLYQEVDAEYQAHLLRQEAARQELLRAAREERRRRRQEVAAQQEAKRRYAAARQRFPAPPIPGTPDILPLTSEHAVWLEGQEQINCVFSYVYSVVNNERYIYRVMAPERATLAIALGDDGSWRRSELKARGNAKVRDATVHAVDAWLASHRVSV